MSNVNQKRSAWMVRAGENGHLYPFFDKNNIVAIGWGDLGDLDQYESRDDLRDACYRLMREEASKTIDSNVGVLYRFHREIQEGDIVVSYHPAEYQYRLAVDNGYYRFSNLSSVTHRYPHIRHVTPIAYIDRKDLTKDAQKSLAASQTLFSIDSSVLADFERVLGQSIDTMADKALEESNNILNNTISSSQNIPSRSVLPEDIQDRVTRFLNQFPIESLSSMPIEQYTNTGSQDYFTYWLEHETARVGGIGGGSSFKYGVFKRANTEEKTSNKLYSYTHEYAWYTKYGASAEVAFETVRNYLARVARYAAHGQVDDIGTIPLDTRVKWKVAFLYQNFSQPCVISIYQQQAMSDLAGLDSQRGSLSEAHRILIDKMPSNMDVWSYSRWLWREWSFLQNEQENAVEQIRLAEHSEAMAALYESRRSVIESSTLDNEQSEADSEDEVAPEVEQNVVLITGYCNDGIGCQDALGIEHEVSVLASIIAYKDTELPLSIGIFGEWGSGKSFYMDALKHQITQLSEMAFTRGQLQRDEPFYKHIVPVEFNAWNYVESDLWASLAHKIYKSLYERIEGEQDPYWLGVLAYSEEEYEQAKETLEAIEKEEAEKQRELDKVTKDIEAQEKKLKASSSIASTLSLEKEQVSEYTRLLKGLGMEAEVNNLHQVSKVVQELDHIHQGLHAIFNAAVWKQVLRSVPFWVCVVVLLSLLLNAFPEDTTSPPAWLDVIKNEWSRALAVVLAGLLGAKNYIKAISSYLAHVQKTRVKLHEDKRHLEEKIKKEQAQLKHDIALIYTKKEQLQHQMASLEKDKSQANNIARVTPERILEKHIKETIGNNRYEKYLGLPAVLSDDFKKLSELIRRANAALEQEDIDTPEAENKIAGAQSRINRIVLFIDDLDRCSPDVVVKVLEAVHLFLASPLFVVVLGVDPRWLFASIQQHYKDIMVDDAAQIMGASTPQEYLEKIFQIPIWLEPPSNKQVSDLIGQTIGYVTEYDAPILPEASGIPYESVIQQMKEETPGKYEVEPETHIAEPVVNKVSLVTEPSLLEKEALSKAQQHNLEEIEIRFIHALSPMIARSPRSIKRYLNVYRLIRSSLPPDDYDTLFDNLDGQGYGYKSVAFLLAIVTGWPEVSSEVFGRLRSIQHVASLEEILGYLEEGDDESSFSPHTLEAFRQAVVNIGQSADDMAPLANWVNVVARYSYSKLSSD